jgi:hypothetical protein
VSVLNLGLPPSPAGYLLVKTIPLEARAAEIEYDTAIGLGAGAGGPDGGAEWAVAFPQFNVDELDAGVGVQMSMAVIKNNWILGVGRKLGDGGDGANANRPLRAVAGPVHVRLAATFGDGGVALTVSDLNGQSSETVSIPFAMLPGNKRVGLGATSNGSPPLTNVVFSHVRVCWR